MSPMYVMGRCYGCGVTFAFHPHKVPSIPIDHEVGAHGLPADMGGDPEKTVREPVCRDCIDLANAMRSTDGRPPIEILDGAYGPWDGE